MRTFWKVYVNSVEAPINRKGITLSCVFIHKELGYKLGKRLKKLSCESCLYYNRDVKLL